MRLFSPSTSACIPKLVTGLLLAAMLLPAGPVSAQEATPERYVQAATGLWPGVGLQVGNISPRGFYSLEGMLYLNHRPDLLGGDDSVQIAGGLGGSLRIIGTLRFFLEDPLAYDIDIGLRLGPGLLFQPEETRADKNRRLQLFLEPFVRYALRLERGWILFAEAGLQYPRLRAGLWLDL